MSDGLVCGFWDEAAGLAGLGWKLGDSRAASCCETARSRPRPRS